MDSGSQSRLQASPKSSKAQSVCYHKKHAVTFGHPYFFESGVHARTVLVSHYFFRLFRIQGSQPRERAARLTEVLSGACSGVLSGNVRHHPNWNHYDY